MSNIRNRRPILSWVALLAMLTVVAVCLRLSWWQLQRAEEKQQWLATQEEKANQPAADLPSLLADPAPLHRQARISGELDNTRNVLLDNRIRNGVAGYHLLTPMQTRENHWVLINRGWLPRGLRREQLPERSPSSGAGSRWKAACIALPGRPLCFRMRHCQTINGLYGSRKWILTPLAKNLG